MCTPNKSRGLGLRRLAYLNKVLALKLVWLIFSECGSFWVSWVRVKMNGESNFRELDGRHHGSWMWRSICKIRDLAKLFVVYEVASGTNAF